MRIPRKTTEELTTAELINFHDYRSAYNFYMADYWWEIHTGHVNYHMQQSANHKRLAMKYRDDLLQHIHQTQRNHK